MIFFLLVAYDALSSCLNPNIRDIKGSRGSILEEVLHVYKESEDVVEDHLQVCFIGEDGIDAGGLDLLTYNVVSFRGQKKLGPRPDRSPLGF